jgi:hypothetical protein
MPEAAGLGAAIYGEGPLFRVPDAGDSGAAGVGVATLGEALCGQLVGQHPGALPRLHRHYEQALHALQHTGQDFDRNTGKGFVSHVVAVGWLVMLRANSRLGEGR